jgi:hydroxyacylglutathione hydrolase
LRRSVDAITRLEHGFLSCGAAVPRHHSAAMSIPFEDQFTDVIGKAQRGLRLSDETIAAQAGVPLGAFQAVLAGGADAATLLAISPVLGLDGAALVAMAQGAWQPAPVVLEGLAQFNTPFDDFTVNAYVAWDTESKHAVAFDTGASAVAMAEFIAARGLELSLIFLTHTHPDHIADLATLRAINPMAPVFINALEPVADAKTFVVGDTQCWQTGGLSIEPRLTTGHSVGGTSYVISGLAKPVAVVGDALFSSSMGGAKVSFADALRTNRSELLGLPDATVVCPGHGPMTTIGEERAHNPFYAEGAGLTNQTSR